MTYLTFSIQPRSVTPCSLLCLVYKLVLNQLDISTVRQTAYVHKFLIQPTLYWIFCAIHRNTCFIVQMYFIIHIYFNLYTRQLQLRTQFSWIIGIFKRFSIIICITFRLYKCNVVCFLTAFDVMVRSVGHVAQVIR